MILPSNMTCFYDVTEFRAFKVEAWRGIGWWGARFHVLREEGKPIVKAVLGLVRLFDIVSCLS